MEDAADEDEMVLTVQILGIGFGLFMLYLFFIHYKRRDITRLEFAAWLLMWTLFLFVSLWPRSLDFLVHRLYFARTLDLFIFLGVLFVVFMTLHVYLQMRKSSTKLERLVRKLAIEKAEKSK